MFRPVLCRDFDIKEDKPPCLKQILPPRILTLNPPLTANAQETSAATWGFTSGRGGAQFEDETASRFAGEPLSNNETYFPNYAPPGGRRVDLVQPSQDRYIQRPAGIRIYKPHGT